MDQLLENVKGCDIALEQVLQERNMLQKKYSEQSCILAHREDEIKQLSTFINQMHEAADTREVDHVSCRCVPLALILILINNRGFFL